MIDRIPRRLRVAFTRAGASPAVETMLLPAPDVVEFVAYGADCVLSGQTVLDGERLSDMLNDHDEYALVGVTIERLDGGSPLAVDDVVVARDEIWMVHAGPPRGVIGRRMRTAQQHVAIKMGPYQIRGFMHSLPGSDAVASITRRKPMIPVTNARIAYTILGDDREVWAETLVVNREQIEWLTAIEPDRAEFPARPTSGTVVPKRAAVDPTPAGATDLP